MVIKMVVAWSADLAQSIVRFPLLANDGQSQLCTGMLGNQLSFLCLFQVFTRNGKVLVKALK